MENQLNKEKKKILFKRLTGFEPQLLSKFVQRLETSRKTRAAASGDCKVPFCQKSFAQNIFFVKGSNLWNSPPTNIASLIKVSTFKKQTSNSYSDN